MNAEHRGSPDSRAATRAAFERAARVPAFRDRLVRAFGEAGGTGDALVELWYAGHAGEEHPDGAQDPDRRRPALTELAFAPTQDPRSAAGAVAALRDFDADRRRERDALKAALAATEPGAAQRADRAAGRTDEGAVVEEAVDEEPGGDAGPRAALRGRRRRVVLVTGAALVAILGLGVAVNAATSTTRRTVPESTASDPSSSSPSPSSPLPSVLSRALDRVEVPTDALPEAIRGEVDLGSSRVIYDEDPSLSVTAERWRLWVGYGEDSSQVCFVATYDNVGDSVSCVPKQRALVDRVVLVSTLPGRRFEMLANGGAIAVQID